MPPASEFDKAWYRKEVLEPALKRGNAPPPDLMLRYAAAGLERNADAFDARIDEVVRYWRELEQKIVFKQLATALLAAHASLKDAGQVSYAHFAQQRDAERDEALTRLKATVSDIAATTPAVLRSTLTGLRDLYGGMFSDSAIRGEFATRQVAVVDQAWPLPPGPTAAVRARPEPRYAGHPPSRRGGLRHQRRTGPASG